MSTTKQIAANPAPTTPQAKAKTRLNPLKHGLTPETIVLPFESQDDYRELQQSILDDLQPKGVTRQILVERFVQRHWISQRIARTERAWLQALYQAQFDEGTKAAKNPKPDPEPYEGLAISLLPAPGDPRDLIHKNFFRYRAQIEQDFQRALRALERNHLLVTPSEESDNLEIGSVSENSPSEPENAESPAGTSADIDSSPEPIWQPSAAAPVPHPPASILSPAGVSPSDLSPG